MLIDADPTDRDRITLERAAGIARLVSDGPLLPAPAVLRDAGARRVGLMLHSRGPLVANGYAARSEEVIGAVTARGWRAEAVTRLGYPRDINRYADADVPTLQTYAGVPCHLLADPVGGLRTRPLDQYVAAYGDAAAQAFGGLAPNVLHAASSWHNGLAMMHAGVRLGAATVYEARGLWEVTALSRGDYPLGTDDARYQLAARMEAAAAEAADAVIVLSEGLAEALAERGVDPAKMIVAPNCAPVRERSNPHEKTDARRLAGFPPDACVVGYLGFVGAYEGLDDLLEAFARARARPEGRTLRLLVVGDGPVLDPLRERAAALSLTDAARFTGRVPRADATRLAGAVDIVALPRRDLPVTRIVPPIKAVEAMARGLPLVVSDLPALTALVEADRTALVVPPGDVAALTDALIRLTMEPDLRASLGAAGLAAAADRFAPDIVGASIERAYERALAARRG